MVESTSRWNRRQFLLVSAATSTAVQPFGQAYAQSSAPPVRIIVAFPPGGSSDTVARKLADALRPRLERNVIVENRAGAGGRIAPEAIKTAPADGNVVLLVPNPLLTQYQSVFRKLPYDPERDLAPVAQVSTYPLLISVGPAVPESVRTLKDYLAWVKSGPRNAFFGSPAAGSTPHFVGVMLGRSAGIDMTHVAYRGDAPAIQDLLGGQVPMCINTPAAQLPHVGGGKLRVLATTGAHRLPDVPDVATVAEQGLPDLRTNDWFGVFAHSATPSPQLERLQSAFRDALSDPSVLESFRKLGVRPAFVAREDFGKQIRQEAVAFAALVKAVGFVPEE